MSTTRAEGAAPAPAGLAALLRVTRFGRPVTGRLALAVAAGVAAAGAAIGLTATPG
jgi:hypothetical protein